MTITTTTATRRTVLDLAKSSRCHRPLSDLRINSSLCSFLSLESVRFRPRRRRSLPDITSRVLTTVKDIIQAVLMFKLVRTVSGRVRSPRSSSRSVEVPRRASLRREIATFLFDLDGTIWDSQRCIVDSIVAASRESGKPLTVARAMVELPRYASPPAYVRSRRIPEKVFWSAYDRNTWKVRPYPDTGAVLRELRSRGRTTGFVTSLNRVYVDRLMDSFEMQGLVDVVVTPSDCHRQKPSPAPIRLALRRAGSTAYKTLYVGNQHSDMVAAKRAGCWFGLARWGVTEAIDFRPDYEFGSMQQVLDLTA
jgi:phosphoglycolate phosphatase-like HAD superfamily hydrolase